MKSFMREAARFGAKNTSLTIHERYHATSGIIVRLEISGEVAMAKFVELDVFSGRPNPVWQIDDYDADRMIAEHRGGNLAVAVTAPVLGYRGFSIVDVPDGDPTQAMIAEAVRSPEADKVFGSPDVEFDLLRSARNSGAVDDVLHAYVQGAIGEPPALLEEDSNVRASCPPCGGRTAPAYNPGYWNNDPQRLRSNNCYNYANNLATNTFAQPGRASGHMYSALDCASVSAAAQRDGLVPVPGFQGSNPGWYVALVIWPGADYHWYRQDKVGCWSHKPGQMQARNVDNAGKPIANPRTCNRGPYTVFCTFMTTHRNAHIA